MNTGEFFPIELDTIEIVVSILSKVRHKAEIIKTCGSGRIEELIDDIDDIIKAFLIDVREYMGGYNE